MQSLSSMLIRCLVLLGGAAISSVVCGSAAMAQELVTKQGRHLRLITDLPDSLQLSELVAAFDAAVPQWADYWQFNAAKLQDWQVTGYLMSGKAPFIAKGLIPAALPDFRNGYQAGNRIWVVNQPSEYYNRHLLLHEGTHAVTSYLFGGSGPPWYMEGTAEFLGTHDWVPHGQSTQGELRLGVMPASLDRVPQWGRIELIARGGQLNEAPTIETVMRYSNTAHREVDAYAWSWLAVTLLEMYPEYQPAVRAAANSGADTSPQFTRAFYEGLRDQWPVLAARWRLLALDLEYGFDRERNRVELPMLPSIVADAAASMSLDVAHGWQAAPFKLAAGQAVEISAEGRFTIRQTPQRWESEPDGVTIEYHRGLPRGRLIACVLPMQPVSGRYLPDLKVMSVGSLATVSADQESWLLLKINEPAGEWEDNFGRLDLRFSVSSQGD